MTTHHPVTSETSHIYEIIPEKVVDRICRETCRLLGLDPNYLVTVEDREAHTSDNIYSMSGRPMLPYQLPIQVNGNQIPTLVQYNPPAMQSGTPLWQTFRRRVRHQLAIEYATKIVLYTGEDVTP